MGNSVQGVRSLLPAEARRPGSGAPTRNPRAAAAGAALTMLSRLFRHAQRTFHMVVGVAFLCLAVAGAAVSFAEWRYYRQAPSVGLTAFGLVAVFTVLLIIFCLYPFAKARSVNYVPR